MLVLGAIAGEVAWDGVPENWRELDIARKLGPASLGTIAVAEALLRDRCYRRFKVPAAACVSPVAWISDRLDDVLEEAARVAGDEDPTEALAVAEAVFRARTKQREPESFTDVIAGASDPVAAAIAGGIAEGYYGVPWQIDEYVHSLLNKKQRRVLDRFSLEFKNGRNFVPVDLGEKILIPEVPEDWKTWPVSIDVDFWLLPGMCGSVSLLRDYAEPTLERAARRAIEERGCFPSYRVYADGVSPAFRWYAAWPLLRRGPFEPSESGQGLIERGTEHWNAADDTLMKIWREPRGYERGVLMLRVHGRSRDEAIANWHEIARPLRRDARERGTSPADRATHWTRPLPILRRRSQGTTSAR